eukprot:Pompholyxophrys_punicea_v1_NODE_463_length_1898_cov_5.250136.p4 type:complete len:101 gc:universal NODE_463_length_1898_cov_5.250136:1349-1651(+)
MFLSLYVPTSKHVHQRLELFVISVFFFLSQGEILPGNMSRVYDSPGCCINQSANKERLFFFSGPKTETSRGCVAEEVWGGKHAQITLCSFIICRHIASLT